MLVEIILLITVKQSNDTDVRLNIIRTIFYYTVFVIEHYICEDGKHRWKFYRDEGEEKISTQGLEGGYF